MFIKFQLNGWTWANVIIITAVAVTVFSLSVDWICQSLLGFPHSSSFFAELVSRQLLYVFLGYEPMILLKCD